MISITKICGCLDYEFQDDAYIFAEAETDFNRFVICLN